MLFGRLDGGTRLDYLVVQMERKRRVVVSFKQSPHSLAARLLQKLLACPVLVAVSELAHVEQIHPLRIASLPAIRHIPPNNQRQALLSQLFGGNVERIRLAFQVDQDRRILTNLQRPYAQDSCSLVLCHVGCGRALVLWNLLRLVCAGRVARRCARRVVNGYDIIPISFLTILVLLRIGVVVELGLLNYGLIVALLSVSRWFCLSNHTASYSSNSPSILSSFPSSEPMSAGFFGRL